MLAMTFSGTEIKNVKHEPCPFCGNMELCVTDEDSYNELILAHDSSMLSIKCSRCDCEKHLYDIPNNNYWMGMGMLVSAWNTRV